MINFQYLLNLLTSLLIIKINKYLNKNKNLLVEIELKHYKIIIIDQYLKKVIEVSLTENHYQIK